LYSCEFCGEVEGDGEGFVVGGKFFPNNAVEDDEFPDERDWETDGVTKKELTLGDVFGGVDVEDDGLFTPLDVESERDLIEPTAGIDVGLLQDDFELDDDGASHGTY